MKKRKFAKINTDKIELTKRIKWLEESGARRDRMITRLFSRLREKRKDIDSLAYIIGSVVNSLPINRDWLDPDIEKAMLSIVKQQQAASEQSSPSLSSHTQDSNHATPWCR